MRVGRSPFYPQLKIGGFTVTVDDDKLIMADGRLNVGITIIMT